jgi:isoamylase
MKHRMSAGEPFPLGATYDGTGTNFSVFSGVAEAVELCLFDDDGTETRYELSEVDAYCWHAWLEGVQPGCRYGYRVHGPYRPEEGLRCNPAKLLIDPYAKALDGEVHWGQDPYSYPLGGDDLSLDTTDSAASMPKAIVIDAAFSWDSDQQPRTRWADTIIYEAHVKGMTMEHPEVPNELRGTYAGLAHPAVIEHLKTLGVTAVELMPVHQFVHDHRLVERGFTNYWGYNSIAYLAPHNGYASKPGHRVVAEFKTMVKALHGAGIEVILDVVYNHTAEGDHLGPTLSMRGLDNQSYYHLVEGEPRYYFDSTGTGNTLNARNPHVLQLIMDSLRYWVLDMHVDGFRFDLAAALARQFHEVDRLSAFFDVIQQDPVVSSVKLIAEPWDLGDGGYQVGNFPPHWSEWNGRYRDSVRDFWRQGGTTVAELATRLAGSPDLYEATGRRPFASVNFVTCHDGFTLADLVSYDHKHNEDNGEANNDGSNDNRSWNCGVEGPTHDPAVIALREQQVRNFLATLLLSQGVPMLLGGDELGRTQAGNNNPYCHDSPLTWYPWPAADKDRIAWTSGLISLRRRHPVLRRRRFFQGRPLRESRQLAGAAEGLADIAWLRPDGKEMSDEDWETGYAKTLGMLLNGSAIPDHDENGLPISDDSLLVLLNAWEETIRFRLPGTWWAPSWVVVLDTACGWAPADEQVDPARLRAAGASVNVAGRSVLLLRSCAEDD